MHKLWATHSMVSILKNSRWRLRKLEEATAVMLRYRVLRLHFEQHYAESTGRGRLARRSAGSSKAVSDQGQDEYASQQLIGSKRTRSPVAARAAESSCDERPKDADEALSPRIVELQEQIERSNQTLASIEPRCTKLLNQERLAEQGFESALERLGIDMCTSPLMPI